MTDTAQGASRTPRWYIVGTYFVRDVGAAVPYVPIAPKNHRIFS